MGGQGRWIAKLYPYIFSLACSVAVGWISYYFFTTSIREAQLRLGSLVVDGTISLINGTERWSASAENTGPLPLSNVSLIFRAEALSKVILGACTSEIPPPKPCIQVEPPVGTATQSADSAIVALGVMPPKDRLVVTIFLPPDHPLVPGQQHVSSRFSGWSRSDANPTTPISWRQGRSMAVGTFTIGGLQLPRHRSQRKRKTRTNEGSSARR